MKKVLVAVLVMLFWCNAGFSDDTISEFHCKLEFSYECNENGCTKSDNAKKIGLFSNIILDKKIYQWGDKNDINTDGLRWNWAGAFYNFYSTDSSLRGKLFMGAEGVGLDYKYNYVETVSNFLSTTTYYGNCTTKFK